LVNLTIPQLAALAANAGFSGDDLVTAVAIAIAESGGNPQAYNPETMAKAPQGKGSFGLWQIYLQAHPELSGRDLFDPPTNASAAFAVYSHAGGSFQPWTTFKTGAYQAYLDFVDQVIAPPASNVVVAADGSMPDVSSADSGSSNLLATLAIGGLLLWAGIEIL
jgi:hypothetical protein